MDLILLRHTRTVAPAGTCYGQADVALAEPHEPGFDTVLGGLAGLALGCVVSSPLSRCALLAGHLAQAMSLPLRTDARWQELHFGAWEGRPWAAIERRESDAWLQDLWHRAPPGGETLASLTQRVHAAMDELGATGGAGALVVCHAGPIRVALARARGLPPGSHPAQELPFGGFIRLRGQRQGAGWSWTEAGA